METSPTFKARTATLLLLLCLMASSAFGQLLPSTHKQYFSYNGTTLALVGISGEYLPHVKRPLKKNVYVTFDSDSLPVYLADLKAKHINKIRMWIGVNHSIGIGENDPATKPNGQPYPGEQPFFFNGSRWRLDRYDTGIGGFFENVKSVLDLCAQNGVFVEVTLVDAFQGTYSTSPWYPGTLDANGNVLTSGNRNLWYDPAAGCAPCYDAGFTKPAYMVSFDNTTCTDLACATESARNKTTRALQAKFIEQAVTALNGYTNFYWEIANEPDFNTNTNPLDIDAMINWHNAVAKKIVAVEGPLLNKHAIAANFITKAALDKIQQNPARLDPSIQILNGHYVDITVKNGIQPRLGAITANNAYNRTATTIDKLFGFGETLLSSPNPDVPTEADRQAWRAEAWEFLMSEGGVYDNLGYGWSTPVASNLRGDLGKLADFINGSGGLQLAALRRETGTTPSWISGGVLTYGTLDASLGVPIYWGSMKRPNGGQFVFYMHHSDRTTALGATGYVAKPKTGTNSYQRTLTFNPGAAPVGYYRLEWFYYPPNASQGAQVTCAESINWSSGTFSRLSPKYSYDLAVRLTYCNSTTTPCITTTTCP